jgi:hypothetical protein
MKYNFTIVVNDCEIHVQGEHDKEDGLTVTSAQGDIYYALVCGVTIGDIEDKIFDKLTDF